MFSMALLLMTDETGGLKACASRDQEEILTGVYDLDDLADKRLEWGLFRDRRPEMYIKINTIKFFQKNCLFDFRFVPEYGILVLSIKNGLGLVLCLKEKFV